MNDQEFQQFIGRPNTPAEDLGARFMRRATAIASLLQRKNADYGNSAYRPPLLSPSMPLESALLVRMSDKIQRFIRLLENPAQVKEETLDDTAQDLAGYLILWLERPRGEGESEVHKDPGPAKGHIATFGGQVASALYFPIAVGAEPSYAICRKRDEWSTRWIGCLADAEDYAAKLIAGTEVESNFHWYRRM